MKQQLFHLIIFKIWKFLIDFNSPSIFTNIPKNPHYFSNKERFYINSFRHRCFKEMQKILSQSSSDIKTKKLIVSFCSKNTINKKNFFLLVDILIPEKKYLFEQHIIDSPHFYEDNIQKIIWIVYTK